MIEYVGVKTAAEANKIGEEFVRENRTRRNIVAIIALCIVALIAGLVCLNVDPSLRKNVCYIAVGVLIAIEVVVFAIYPANLDWNCPIVYKFFKATDGFT